MEAAVLLQSQSLLELPPVRMVLDGLCPVYGPVPSCNRLVLGVGVMAIFILSPHLQYKSSGHLFPLPVKQGVK